jgi:hypothetical protein
MHSLILFLQHVLGIDTQASMWYNFWSGFGGCLAEFAILGGFIKFYKDHNCKVPHCWRVGHHPVDGTNYITCHKHATVSHHGKLHLHHLKNHPDQHELLNPDLVNM